MDAQLFEKIKTKQNKTKQHLCNCEPAISTCFSLLYSTAPSLCRTHTQDVERGRGSLRDSTAWSQSRLTHTSLMYTHRYTLVLKWYRNQKVSNGAFRSQFKNKKGGGEQREAPLAPLRISVQGGRRGGGGAECCCCGALVWDMAVVLVTLAWSGL